MIAMSIAVNIKDGRETQLEFLKILIPALVSVKLLVYLKLSESLGYFSKPDRGK